jgi:hypothetical protein
MKVVMKGCKQADDHFTNQALLLMNEARHTALIVAVLVLLTLCYGLLEDTNEPTTSPRQLDIVLSQYRDCYRQRL